MENQLTGILHSDQGEVSFVLENFLLKILPPSFYRGTEEVKEFKFEKDDNGFIHGWLYSGRKILFWVGDSDIECMTEHHVYLNLYILGGCLDEEQPLFQGIEITGASINNIVGNTKKEYREIIGHVFDDDDLKAHLKIRVGHSESHSLFEETKKCVSNISFEFSEPQPFEKTLRCFHWIQNICQFMTYRNDAHIDTFEIIAPNENLNGVYTPVATCYIKPISSKDIDYHFLEMLNFNDIGKENIVNLFNVFNVANKQPPYLNFLPEDSDVARYIDIVKVKEICAALECEAGYVLLDDKDSPQLETLKRQIKDIVKSHRDGDAPLEKTKTYDVILGEMKHWNLSLSDKLKILSDEYSYILVNIGSRYGFDYIARYEDIDEFVKLRNFNSHGRFTKVSRKQAGTGFWMIGLVYCCLLKRIGLDMDSIEKSVKKIFR